MNAAVKLWATMSENAAGVPGIWPAEIKELGDGTSLPDGSYSLMTCVEFKAYRTLHRATYDAWVATQE